MCIMWYHPIWLQLKQRFWRNRVAGVKLIKSTARKLSLPWRVGGRRICSNCLLGFHHASVRRPPVQRNSLFPFPPPSRAHCGFRFSPTAAAERSKYNPLFGQQATDFDCWQLARGSRGQFSMLHSSLVTKVGKCG